MAARAAIRLDPMLADGYVQLGIALQFLGDKEAALRAQTRAVELSRNASLGLALLYELSFGRLDEAARWWGPALRLDPTNPANHWQAGRTYLNLGMNDRARRLMERSLALDPQFVLARYQLIQIALLEGRHDEARDRVRSLAARAGTESSAHVYAGMGAAKVGDLSAARAYLEVDSTVIHGSSREAPNPQITLAWLLQRAGEPEYARSLVRTATARLEDQTGFLGYYYWMSHARLQVVQGNREAAVRDMEQAVRHGWRFLYEEMGDPVLGSLTGHPRYDRLMAEVKADVDRQRARVLREGC